MTTRPRSLASRRPAPVRLAALGLLVPLALAGCSSEDAGPGEGSGDAPTASLTFQVAGDPEETAVYEAIATAYNDTDPATTVEIVAVPSKGDHLALLQTSFAAGDAPEVFLLNYREYAPFVRRGALTPVAGLLERRGIDLVDYYEPPVDAFTLDGALQCMPQNVSSLVVYVNTALFAQAGIDLPVDGWEFQDFVAAAQALASEDVDGVYVEPSVIRVTPFAWSDGAEITDDPEEPTRLTLDDKGTRQVVGLLASLQTSGLMPTEEELAAKDADTRFMDGELAMILSSRKSVPLYREAPTLDFDVAPLPTLGEPATILHSDAYCLSSQAEDASAAADFIAFAVGPQGQSIAALGGRTVPSLISVAESGAFLNDTVEPAHSEVFLEAIEGMRATPVLAGWPQVEDLAEEYLTRIWYDATTTKQIDELIDELDERTRPLFEED
ncbi:MAG: sugar ABC transporter substrate-binding protein [Actinobacteria bacterium]|nr:sugar ABC transporter substrate-binding protein [Actinomycetota bacterium]MBU2110869.1 sugar ABC transporter substrate-binding protein [Actinomycetota bacterium]